MGDTGVKAQEGRVKREEGSGDAAPCAAGWRNGGQSPQASRQSPTRSFTRTKVANLTRRGWQTFDIKSHFSLRSLCARVAAPSFGCNTLRATALYPPPSMLHKLRLLCPRCSRGGPRGARLGSPRDASSTSEAPSQVLP
ncbi:hypothetical protein AAFF_G00005470 [Aldrovandia affinis]|uniref:Uncharacterized protein n=1 Tax=Aldrovandia affinis TaxID=143900 RepID=A0AAD7TE22_9TELE|nr:hypothetical protein AAFF_G00005470 [Aldrovandia affinis]